MNLIERDSYLDVLRSLHADSVEGRGRITLISGGIATGKTELIYGFTEIAGGTLLSATGGRGEQELELGVVGQLFHSAALPADVAGRAADLLAAALARGEQGADARFVHEICALLLDLAREHPLVIAVDDVQFADPASLRVLLSLQRRIRSARVLLILAEAIQSRPAHTTLRDEIIRQPQSRHLRLAPLSRDGVGELLARHLGRQAAQELADPCHVLSGGSPLLVHALIDDYMAAGRPVTDNGVAEPVTGDSFGHAVFTCLRRGEPLLLRVAQGVAVLAEFATPALLGRLLDLDTRTVQDLFKIMNEAGLMDAGRFRHPVARAAVLRDLDPDELSSLRIEVAQLLHDDGVAAAEVAKYVTAAGRAPDGWAVTVLRDAAVQALVRNEISRAVDCFELALSACEDEREQIAITSMLVTAQWLADPAAAARHLPQLGAAFEQGHLAERQAWSLLRALAWHGRSAEAAEMLAQLNKSDEPRDTATEAERQVTRQWLFYTQPQLLTQDGAADVENSLGSLASVAAFGATPAAIDGAERVLQSSRIGETPLEELVTALQTLSHGDRGDRAGYWCEELLEEATSHRATTWRAVLSDVAAGVALRRGDLVSAERHARTALSALSAPSWGVAIGSPLAHLVQATTRLGKFDEADNALRQGIPQAMQGTRFWLQYVLARGQHYLATDRLRAALGDFLTVGELAMEWQLDLPVLVPWRHEAAQVYVRLGKPDRARELVGEQLTMPGATGARLRGISLRVLASASDADRRLPMLRESVELLRGPGDWYELALAFADLSCAYQVLADFDQARVAARRALRLAKSCQAKLLQEHLQHNRTATGGTDFGDTRGDEGESLAPLSAAERRVASLAALGHTNREISRRLYITVSTVEQHLTRTYRKLNINRRTDLPIVSMPGPGTGGAVLTESGHGKPGMPLPGDLLI